MFSLRNKKNIFELSSIPLLSGALIGSVSELLHNRIMTSNIQEYLSLIKPWIDGKRPVKDRKADNVNFFA